MANDGGGGSSDWFTKQLSDLKGDMGQLEDKLRRPDGKDSGGSGQGGRGRASASAGISQPPT
ncbi:MAG: hypothetical protein HN394_16210, partial [Rhodospirillaceae bacterium]|nr:hypothetical protein [Rhodospirillaceae bacterium]